MDTATPNSEIFICPILHPAFILRGKWSLDPFQSIYIQSAWRLANGQPYLDVTKKRPLANINPTIGEIAAFFREIESRADPGDRVVTVDIECAGHHLTRVGFCDVTTERSVIMTFRLKRGRLPNCSPRELEARIEMLYDALANKKIGKVFHNGASFDITILEEIGFTVEHYIFDTMIAWHTAWPETPKRLEFVAGVFGLPKWKHLSQDEDDVTAK